MSEIKSVRKNIIESSKMEILGKQRFINREIIKDKYCYKCKNRNDIKKCRLENDDIDNQNCKRFENKGKKC